MALSSNLIILMFILSFAIYLGTPQHFSPLILNIVNGSFDIQNSALYVQIALLLGVAATIGLIASLAVGSFTFPNPYLIFYGIGAVLLGMTVLPIDLLTATDVPSDIKLFVGGTFGLLYLLAMISWYKGQPE